MLVAETVVKTAVLSWWRYQSACNTGWRFSIEWANFIVFSLSRGLSDLERYLMMEWIACSKILNAECLAILCANDKRLFYFIDHFYLLCCLSHYSDVWLSVCLLPSATLLCLLDLFYLVHWGVLPWCMLCASDNIGKAQPKVHFTSHLSVVLDELPE